MRLRSAAAAVTIALIATACAAEGAGRVHGGQTAQEVTAAGPSANAGSEPGTASGGEGTDDAAATTGSEAETVEALWWTAETVADGSEFAAADLAGEHVVLWPWAPWCSVCNREAPEVAEALAALPDDVTVVGVAGRDEVGPMRDIVAEHGLREMTHVVDGSIWASYGISYQPAWVFVDADGRASLAAGMLGYDGLLAAVDEAFRT